MDSTQSEVARVHVVGDNTVQTHLFVNVLNQQLPVSLHNRLEDALSVACLRAGMQSLVLVDARYLRIEQVLQVVDSTKLPTETHLALLNVSRQPSEGSDCVLHGIRGLFFEDDEMDTIIKGVQEMLEDGIWVPRRTLFEAAVHPRSSSGAVARHGSDHGPADEDDLTPREREILALICVGASNQDISDKLFISTNTVKTHIYKIYKKIHVPNRMQAALWGAKHL